jgi:hypothetical protein
MLNVITEITLDPDILAGVHESGRVGHDTTTVILIIKRGCSVWASRTSGERARQELYQSKEPKLLRLPHTESETDLRPG